MYFPIRTTLHISVDVPKNYKLKNRRQPMYFYKSVDGVILLLFRMLGSAVYDLLLFSENPI